MKKLLKILAWIFGIFVGVIVLLIISFKLFFPIEKAKEYAIKEAENYLGRDVSIETIDISFWGGLGLALVDVKVSNPEGFQDGNFLETENVDVKMQLWPLLRGEFRVDRFILNGPNIALHKLADGRNNYTFETKDTVVAKQIPENLSPGTATAAAAVSFERFEINNGNIHYVDDSSKLGLDLSGLYFKSALQNPQANLYQSSGNLDINSLVYSGDEIWPPLNVEMDYVAELDFARQRLSVQQSQVKVNDISIRIEGELFDFKDALNGRVSIRGEQISAEQVMPLLAASKQKMLNEYNVKGKFDLDLDIEYDKRKADPLYYSGTINIIDVSLQNDAINGELKFKQALIDFKPDNIRANIEGGTFNNQPFKGHLVLNDFENPYVNGDVTGSTDLSIFQPLLDKKGDMNMAGKANIDLKFSGPVKEKLNLKYSGNLSVDGGKFNAEFLPEPIDALSMDLYFDNEVTNVRKISAHSKSAKVIFTGRFENVLNYYLAELSERPSLKKPQVTGNVDGNADLSVLNTYLKEKRGGSMTGVVAFKLNVSGSPVDISELKPHGNMSITNGSLKDTLLPEPINYLSANFTVVADTFKVDSMSVRFESSDVAMRGRVIRPVPYFLKFLGVTEGEPLKPLFELNLISKKFNVDKMFPEAVPGSEAITKPAEITKEPSMVLPDMNGTGTFAIDTLIYSEIEFTNIKGDLRVQDRKMDCYNVSGNVYAGKVIGETSIDLNDFANPKYTGEFKANDVEADDFMKRFSKFGGFLFGKIDVDGTYNATGWDREAFLNSLTMDGLAQMTKGKIVTSGPTYQAVNAIASSVSLKFDKEQPVKNLNSKLQVKDGKVGLDNLKTSMGNLGDVEIGGFYSFAGGLDYKGSILLSKDATKKVLGFITKEEMLGGITGLFTDKSVERIKLPLLIEGTVDEPKFKVDMAGLTKTAGQNVMNKLGNFLKDQLKKDDSN